MLKCEMRDGVCVFVHAWSLVLERWMPSLKVFTRSFFFPLHWLKSTAEKQFPDKVFGFQSWCQVCRSLISSMLYIKGLKFLPAVTGKLGNKKLPWCSPYAPISRQAWTCISISPDSCESLSLCSLSALVQKELNNKSWCSTKLEFKDKGTFGRWFGSSLISQTNCFAVDVILVHRSFCRTASWKILHYGHPVCFLPFFFVFYFFF